MANQPWSAVNVLLLAMRKLTNLQLNILLDEQLHVGSKSVQSFHISILPVMVNNKRGIHYTVTLIDSKILGHITAIYRVESDINPKDGELVSIQEHHIEGPEVKYVIELAAELAKFIEQGIIHT